MSPKPDNSRRRASLTPNESILGPYDAIVEGPTEGDCLKRAALLLAVSPERLDHIVLDRGVQNILGTVNLPYRCRTYSKGGPVPSADTPAQAPSAADGPAVVRLPVAAKIKVGKGDDRMLATIMVTLPGADGQDVTVAQLTEALQRAGVTTGIDHGRLREIAERKLYHDVHVVAQGLPGRPSRDARIDFKVRLERRPAPAIDENGHADFHEINLVESVCSGQVLAVKIPKDDGLPGQDVAGKLREPEPARDVTVNAGKNVLLREDGLTYTAAIDGQVKFANNSLSIDPVLEIRGDVDLHTGNITFLGTVRVSGSVLDNFTVRASQDVIIGGSVNMAQVEADGDVQVRGGIIGKELGTVVAGGNITAKFVESARLRAGRNVIVTESVLHSSIDAGQVVALTGKKALIAGGCCRAGHAVYAREIGSAGGSSTVIEVGLQLRMRDRVRQAEEELARQTLLLSKVVLGLKGLNKLRLAAGQLPPEREAMHRDLNQVAARLQEKVAALGSEIDTMRGEMTGSITDGKVSAMVRIHPRVQLAVGRAVLLVSEPVEFATVRCERGEIVIQPYEKPNLKKLLAGLTEDAAVKNGVTARPAGRQ